MTSANGHPSRRSLADTRAKSKPKQDPERLTAHSRTVHDTVGQIRDRIGSPGVLAQVPGFWDWIPRAGLLHDAGKVAEGFQRSVTAGEPWGERHEVLSLAYVDLLAEACRWSGRDRLMVATLVATHHRALFPGGGQGKRTLTEQYNEHTVWEEAFTKRPHLGGLQIQVTPELHRELLAWFCGALAADLPPVGGPKLAHRARALFVELTQAWREPVDPEQGLVAVLAQGALTLADHTGSAHVRLQTHLPLPLDYLTRLARPYLHQRQAADTNDHLILIAPTGSGKTEGGLAWAGRQVTSMPGQPRLVWVLPYRASINATARWFAEKLDPPAGAEEADIGILHSTVAQTLLTQAADDDCPTDDTSGTAPAVGGTPAPRSAPAAATPSGPKPATGSEPTAAMARQARARENAMRLFTQRVRVSTPHQLLRAAIAGPTHSSVLLEQANSLFVLDELHAYDPVTFGRLCAAMNLWERLGSRVAVLSATLAPPMTNLIRDSLTRPVTLHRAPAGTSPDRHRLVLDDTPLTDPASRQVLEEWILAGYSVLAVTNTVAIAQHLFDTLAPIARERHPGEEDAALLLHSRFRHRDRAGIERRLHARHHERTGHEPAHRGGLVVATQAVEVSLRLDFDRSAVEAAPIEPVAQRAGRVNRRGLHPEGPVAFRVHRGESPAPYPAPAVDAAWQALTALTTAGTDTLSEQDIDHLLHLAYDTDWGRSWAQQARKARDDFATAFLTFDEPFRDRSEFAKRLDEAFDGAEVLHTDDIEEFHRLAKGPDGNPLRAAGLLIPVRYGQLRQLHAGFDKSLNVHTTSADYDPATGLHIPTSATTPPPAVQETVL
ncbi:CRISPR-associated helicase Cas3' [Streptomyces capparidis]